MNEANLKYLSQSIQRAIDILLAFTDEEPEWGITELSDALNIPKSAVHRVLVNLETRGLLERDDLAEKYRLGLVAFEVGTRAGRRMDLQQVTRPLLEELASQTGETACLAILSAGEVLMLDTIESSRALRVSSVSGQHRPVHCSSVGKALIAWLPEYVVAQLAEERGLTGCTPNTITDLERLYQELAAVREQGYALDLEEFEEDLCCAGAPIRDSVGAVVAAISVSGPKSRFDAAVFPHYIEVVQAAAQAISRKMGYVEVPTPALQEEAARALPSSR